MIKNDRDRVSHLDQAFPMTTWRKRINFNSFGLKDAFSLNCCKIRFHHFLLLQSFGCQCNALESIRIFRFDIDLKCESNMSLANDITYCPL